MRKTSIAIVATLAATLVTAPAYAKASREESIGVGTGAAVGAAAGGPVGFIIGAAIGAKLGDNWHRKNERMDGLQGTLQESEATVYELEGDIVALSNEVEQLRGIARPELVSLMEAGIAMDLLFRTDEFALADSTGDRLAQLAGTLATMPDIQIQLDGYADERGDEEYNLELSGKRVEFVREQLLAAGIHPNRISVTAHGESVAQDATIDSYALERRVSVKLFIDDTQSVASTP